VRESQYKNRCSSCGKTIAVNETAVIVRSDDDRIWLVFHPNASCQPIPPSFGRERYYAILHLRPTAPKEVVKAAYRALASLHHPDRGGNQDAMKSINDAMDHISGRR